MTDTRPGMHTRPRATLLRWSGWFFIITAAVMGLIGLRYLFYWPVPDGPLALFYAAVAYLGHFALLGFAAVALLAPLIILLPKPQFIKPLAIVITALMLALLLLDTLVFAQNRFHLNALTVAVLGWQSWLFAGVYLLIFLLLASLLARQVSRWLHGRVLRRGPWLAAALVSCVLLTHVLHIWADARYYVPITSFSPYLPLFHPLTAKGFLTRHDIIDVAAGRDRGAVKTLTKQSGQRLDYPRQPLSCSGSESPYNVMLILIDAMRGDSLRPDWAPEISAFAENAHVFKQHYSGGNSSRTGTFSLFYGLPTSYWSDFNNSQIPPLLMDQFQAHDYDFGLFTSEPLYRVTSMDRTVFAGLPSLPATPDKPVDYERDQAITGLWLEWLDQHEPDKPFFGFLFYDSLNHQEFPPDYPRVLEPADNSELAKKRADYTTSLHFLDNEIGQVLDDLQRRSLLEKTIVIISADHGQEFDDSGLGYVGYGSNYSKYQLHVPLVVHWPGRKPGTSARLTAHRDIPVTLLQQLFNCSNASTDYSTGNNLFDGAPWQWLVAGSYHDYAVVEPDRVTVVQPGGYFEIRDSSYQLLKDAHINREVINAALAAMSRYYQ